MKKIKAPYLAYLFVALILTYLVLTLLLSANRQAMVHYHISSLALRILDVTIVLPVAGIWTAAFYGFTKLRQYAELISNNRDGKQMHRLAFGVGILAFCQPTASIISTILNYFSQHHPSFLPTTTIVNNYISLLIPLAAFVVIGEAARGFTDITKQRPSQRQIQLFALLLVLIGAGYCYFVFNGLPSVRKLALSSSHIYYLPDWVILLTIVVPYIFVWFNGMLASMDIYLYQQKIKGVIYKGGMGLVALGVGFIIISSIVLQYLVTLSGRILELRISAILLIVYPLLVLISAGYIMIAIGAKRLRKIEVV